MEKQFPILVIISNTDFKQQNNAGGVSAKTKNDIEITSRHNVDQRRKTREGTELFLNHIFR